MQLLVEGLSYRVAPVEIRERLFLSGESLRDWLKGLRRRVSVSGGAILSTCNRTEFYLTAPALQEAHQDLREMLQQADPDLPWEDHSYQLTGRDALAHLFRVPSGLDSAILGEAQILGQFKAALGEARVAGLVDGELDFFMRRAISVAKRVRSETAIGRNAVGFGHAALHQARAIFGNLKGRSALLVGTGKMAGSTARLLAADGIARLYFSTRTAERAMELASSMPHGVMTMTVPFSHLDEVGGEVDLIISSSSSPEHLFTRSIVEGYMRRRRRRPLFMLDLALPRDIAPDVAEVEDAYVYNIDDLAREVERGLSERGKAMPAAEAIVRQELERTTEAMQQRQAGPAIAALIEEAEALRRREVERNLPPGLTPAQRNDIEQLTRSLTQKMLHPAISYLRQNPHDQDAALLLRRLFGQKEGSS